MDTRHFPRHDFPLLFPTTILLPNCVSAEFSARFAIDSTYLRIARIKARPEKVLRYTRRFSSMQIYSLQLVISRVASRKRAQVTAHRGEQFRSDVDGTSWRTTPVSPSVFSPPQEKLRGGNARAIDRAIDKSPPRCVPALSRSRWKRVAARQRGSRYVDAPIPCSWTFRRRRVSGASLPGLLKFVNMKSRRPPATFGGA